jgi:hypothetical protein
MEDRLADAMSRRTNAELIEIASSDTGLHEPAEIAAARAELEHRITTADDVREAIRHSDLRRKEHHERADAPLEARWKLLAFLCPGIISLRHTASYKANGYTRKIRDVQIWSWLGTLFWIGCAVVIVWLVR